MIAEKSLLGSMLKEKYLFDGSDLQPEQFADSVNRSIYTAMLKMKNQNKPVDVASLLMFNNPQDLGGANYVRDLLDYANEEKFEDYSKALHEIWREQEKRKLYQQANTEDWPIDTIITRLSALETNKADDHMTLTEMLADVYEDPFLPKEIKTGVPTGITRLTEMTNGWQDGELTILAARPSMGKTDVMLHISKEAGWNNRLPIIFSLEMKASLLRDRLIASTGKFSRVKMRNPYEMLTEGQKKEWSTAIGRLSTTKMQIFDKSQQTLSEIRAKIRKAMHEEPGRKPIILIDYLTLIASETNLGSNHLNVGAITKGLKTIAKEFDCPVIVLAQLTRGLEQRSDKRPMLSDLRESGSIEEDADVVVFLFRSSYYDKEEDDKTLELIVAKNRNGPVGTVITEYNTFTGSVGASANYQTAAV